MGEDDIKKISNIVGRIKDIFFKVVELEKEDVEKKVITDEADVKAMELLSSQFYFVTFEDRGEPNNEEL